MQGYHLSGAVVQGSKQKWALSKRILIPYKEGVPDCSGIRTLRSRNAQNGLNTFLPGSTEQTGISGSPPALSLFEF